MKHRGVPPSLDRLEFRRFKIAFIAGGTVLVVCAVAALSLYLHSHPGLDRQGLMQGFARQQRAAAEEELENAHKAVRRFVTARLADRGARPLRWPGVPRHEGHHGWYFIEGLVEAGSAFESKTVLLYQVRLALRPDGDWQLESIQFQNPVRPRPKNTDEPEESPFSSDL